MVLQVSASAFVVILAGFCTVIDAPSVQASPSAIIISGNDELALSSQVTAGVGSENDPFIIEAPEINETAYWNPVGGDVAFVLANTTAYVIIRNADFHVSGLNPFNSEANVVIWNCTNVVVEEFDFRDSYLDTFLTIANSSQIELSGNRFEGSRFIVDNSTDVVITRNSVLWGSTGILVQSSSNIEIWDNYIRHCGVGVSLRNSTGVVVTQITMVDNTVDFLDDNTDGANTYMEASMAMEWTTGRISSISIVLVVEVVMAFLALKRYRTMRKPGDAEFPAEPEEEEWRW